MDLVEQQERRRLPVIDELKTTLFSIRDDGENLSKRVYTILFAGPPKSGKYFMKQMSKDVFIDQGCELSILTVKETMCCRFKGRTVLGIGSGYEDYQATLITDLNDAVANYRSRYSENGDIDPPFLFLILAEMDKATSDVFRLLTPLFEHGELLNPNGKEIFKLPSKTVLTVACTSTLALTVNDVKSSIMPIKEHMKNQISLDLTSLSH
jgi:hypothetical protein